MISERNSLGIIYDKKGFLGSSAGKESACNAGNPSSIPGLVSSPASGGENASHFKEKTRGWGNVKYVDVGTFLVVQWLRFCAPNVGQRGSGLIPG